MIKRSLRLVEFLAWTNHVAYRGWVRISIQKSVFATPNYEKFDFMILIAPAV